MPFLRKKAKQPSPAQYKKKKQGVEDVDIEGLPIVASLIPSLSDSHNIPLDPRENDPELQTADELRRMESNKSWEEEDLMLNRLFLRRFIHRDIFTTYDSPRHRVVPDELKFQEQYLVGRDIEPAKFAHQNRRRRMYCKGKLHEPASPSDGRRSQQGLRDEQKRRSVSQALVDKNAVPVKPVVGIGINGSRVSGEFSCSNSISITSPDLSSEHDDPEGQSVSDSGRSSGGGFYSPPSSTLDDGTWSPVLNTNVGMFDNEPLKIQKRNSNSNRPLQQQQQQQTQQQSQQSQQQMKERAEIFTVPTKFGDSDDDEEAIKRPGRDQREKPVQNLGHQRSKSTQSLQQNLQPMHQRNKSAGDLRMGPQAPQGLQGRPRAKSTGQINQPQAPQAPMQSKSRYRLGKRMFSKDRNNEDREQYEGDTELPDGGWVPPIPTVSSRRAPSQTEITGTGVNESQSRPSSSPTKDFDFFGGSSADRSTRQAHSRGLTGAPPPLRQYHGHYARHSVVNVPSNEELEKASAAAASAPAPTPQAQAGPRNAADSRGGDRHKLFVNTGIPPKVPPHRMLSNGANNAPRSVPESTASIARSAQGSDMYTRRCTLSRRTRPQTMYQEPSTTRDKYNAEGDFSSSYMLSGYERGQRLQVVNGDAAMSSDDDSVSSMPPSPEKLNVLSRKPRSTPRQAYSCYDKVDNTDCDTTYHYGLEMLGRGNSIMWKSRGNAFLARTQKR